MPQVKHTNPSKNGALRHRGRTAGLETSPTWFGTEKRADLKQCAGCASSWGIDESGLCLGCRRILANGDSSGHNYFTGYLGGCRCDQCLASRDRYMAYQRERRSA